MTDPFGKRARVLIGDGRGNWDDIGAVPLPDAGAEVLGMDIGSTRDFSVIVHHGPDGPEIADAAYVRQPFAEAEEAIRNFMSRQREAVDTLHLATNAIANYNGLLGRKPRDLPEGTMTRQRRRAEERAARKGRRVD